MTDQHLIRQAHQHARRECGNRGAAGLVVSQCHFSEAVGRRQPREFQFAIAPLFRDDRFAVENDVHVIADAAFPDDRGACFERAFLGTGEQLADLGGLQPLKGLDAFGQFEQ